MIGRVKSFEKLEAQAFFSTQNVQMPLRSKPQTEGGIEKGADGGGGFCAESKEKLYAIATKGKKEGAHIIGGKNGNCICIALTPNV